MKSLGGLLEQYQKRLKPPQAGVERVSIEVIESVTGFTLEATAVTYTPASRTLSLNAPSIVKQEIKLRSDEILKELTRKLGATNGPKTIL